MAGIARLGRRTRQPAGRVDINWGDALFSRAKRSEVAIWTPTSPGGVVTGTAPAVSGTSQGLAGVFNGSSHSVIRQVAGTGSTGVTMFMLVRSGSAPSTAGSVSQPIGRMDAGGFASLNFSWDHPNSSFYKAWAINDGSWKPSGYTSLAADTWYLLSATHSPITGLRTFLNGAFSSSDATATGFIAVPTSNFFIGSGASDGATPSSHFNGQIALAGYVGAAWTDAEHAELARNVWRVHAPQRKQSRIFIASAGGGATVAVPAGALTLTGYAPTVAATAHQTIAVPKGALVLSAFAPTVSTSAAQTIAVPLASLTLTGYAPTVAATAHQTISVPAASLTLTAYAPTVYTTAVTTIAVPAGTLTLTGYAPTVSYTTHASIGVPAGALTLTGYAPTVTGGESSIWTPASASSGTWTPTSASGGTWTPQ